MPDARGVAYTTERGKAYDRYINSRAWAQKRAEYWARYGKTCKVKDCGSVESLEVHHHTYERLGREELTDLVGVCRTHHQEIHARHELDRRRSLTLVAEEVTGLQLRKKKSLAQRQKRQSPATKKKKAPAPVAGKKTSILDTVSSRERERRLTPKQRQKVSQARTKSQRKADERQQVMDRRARITRLHQQSQEVARRLAASEK